MLVVDNAFPAVSYGPLLPTEYSCARSHFLAFVYSDIGGEHALLNGLILELICVLCRLSHIIPSNALSRYILLCVGYLGDNVLK